MLWLRHACIPFDGHEVRQVTMVRHRSRWWTALAGAVVLPSVVWLGPTLAGPSGGVRYRALVNPNAGGAVAVKADGTSVALGTATSPAALTLVGEADVVDVRVTSSGDLVVLQADGAVTAAGGRGLSCGRPPRSGPRWASLSPAAGAARGSSPATAP